MILPKLAPSAAHLLRTSVSTPMVQPTDSDWTTLYPEIERLYIRERRKLRYIMQYIEEKYGLKATQQMYKKRFAKWGIQKNSRRSSKSTPISTTSMDKDVSSSENPYSVPVSPDLSSNDGLILTLLTGVRTWSLSFYEGMEFEKETSPSIQYSWPEGYHDMNLTFKLMIDMLNRGHGDLAGRVARKAFLLAEETLMLAGPALLWNMLEIMCFMMTSQHLKLFQLLLAHMKALVDIRLPKSHPLPTIFRALSASIADTSGSTPVPKSTSRSFSPRISSIDGRKKVIITKTTASYSILLSVLEQAWKLNAEILFQNFHQRFFQLYSRVHWDTCSIEPPTTIFAAAKQWMTPMKTKQGSSAAASGDQSEDYIRIIPSEEDRMLQSLLLAPADSVFPGNYELQRMNSTKMLREHAISILSKTTSPSGESSTLLRILASLVTEKALEDWYVKGHASEMDEEMPSILSRGEAGIIACALRTIMYLNNDKPGIETYVNTAGQIRSILALREYAKSGADPRVVREMWLLEDVLTAAGEYQRASEVKQAAFQRLEQYIQDIPLHSV